MTTFDLKRKDPRFKKTQITVDVYHTWVVDEDGLRQGFSRFKSFTTAVYNEDETEQIGIIGGGTGAVTLSRLGNNEGEWTIHHDDLWFAFLEALEKLDEENLIENNA